VYGSEKRVRVRIRRPFALAVAGSVLAACLASQPVSAAVRPAPAAAPQPRMGHVDVLFIGAHPDDESGDLATFGQWNEYAKVSVGELTLTRGEGGGDAVGSLSGPPLALYREAEQRRALGFAGMHDVYYLDKPDFYYTTSEITVAKDWTWQSTLAEVVRIVRETEPKVIVTMGPSPFPGQHGAHQFSGRAAITAYQMAANPDAFRSQITQEHLRPWAVDRVFAQAYPGTTPPGIGTAANGPGCASSLKPTDPSADNFGVWAGTPSASHHTTWAQVEVDADHQYRSQGFAGIPPAPKNPDKIGCEWFTQVASRVPFSTSDHRTISMLDGAVVPDPGGLPLGTQFSLSGQRYDVVPGTSLTVTAHVAAPASAALPHATVQLTPPPGWTVSRQASLGTIAAGQSRSARFTLTVPAGAAPGTRLKVGGVLRTTSASGKSDTPLQVVAAVTATPPLLDEMSVFDAWAQQHQVPQLDASVLPVMMLGSGQSRPVQVTVKNQGRTSESGQVSLRVPHGFSVTPAARSYHGLPAGTSELLTFRLANTDTSLPTGSAGGNYPFTITTTNATTSADVQHDAINLVPTTTIPEATVQPVVDGKQTSPGEYPGPTLDVSHDWQGPACPTSAACSASAKLSWYGNSLYALVNVKANSPGTILAPGNCQQVWRTDAVTLEVDPKGTYAGDDPSTDLQFQILPQTRDPAQGNPPCDQSDADFHQTNTYGQITTAKLMPGAQLASIVSKPFTGYSVEVRIPFADLPSAVNPADMGLNIINYYSSNDHLIGTTRLAWSAFSSAQSNPYDWGVARLAGYKPANPGLKRPVVFPNTPLAGLDSPQSILQAARTGVPLSGAPLAAPGDSGRLTGTPSWSQGAVNIRLHATGAGSYSVFVWDPVTGRTRPQAAELAHIVLTVPRAGGYRIKVPLRKAPPPQAEMAVTFRNPSGANDSSASATISGG
jgi:LmbE family N-acetylglucosaminyl deacetylase